MSARTVVLSFSGDPFLTHRAARRALAARGFAAGSVTELGEGMDAERVTQLAAQSGLFGQVALLLDFDAAFHGQAGVKPRNETIKALGRAPADTVVVVIDSGASASRQKSYRALGEHDHLPTPRFNALTHWIRDELKGAGVRVERDVPALLADLFGEDLPGIASEITKLAVFEEELDAERVRTLVNRPAARDAFDLIEAVAAGETAAALRVLASLTAQGEAAPRILGALAWQFDLVARCVGLRESRARVDAGLVRQTLKVSPYVAKKALAIAERLDEASLRTVVETLVAADVAMKTGRDELWALRSLVLELAPVFAPAGRVAR